MEFRNIRKIHFLAILTHDLSFNAQKLSVIIKEFLLKEISTYALNTDLLTVLQMSQCNLIAACEFTFFIITASKMLLIQNLFHNSVHLPKILCFYIVASVGTHILVLWNALAANKIFTLLTLLWILNNLGTYWTTK